MGRQVQRYRPFETARPSIWPGGRGEPISAIQDLPWSVGHRSLPVPLRTELGETIGTDPNAGVVFSADAPQFFDRTWGILDAAVVVDPSPSRRNVSASATGRTRSCKSVLSLGASLYGSAHSSSASRCFTPSTGGLAAWASPTWDQALDLEGLLRYRSAARRPFLLEQAMGSHRIAGVPSSRAPPNRPPRNAMVEEHGNGQQLCRFRSWPKAPAAALAVLLILVTLAAFAVLDRAWVACVSLGLMAAVLGFLIYADCAIAMHHWRSALAQYGTGIRQRFHWKRSRANRGAYQGNQAKFACFLGPGGRPGRAFLDK
jgi:hypothetical protein